VSGVSGAAGRCAASLINKRNFNKSEYRMFGTSIVECRRNEFCLFQKRMNDTRRKRLRCASETTIRNSVRRRRTVLRPLDHAFSVIRFWIFEFSYMVSVVAPRIEELKQSGLTNGG
jgi:hypothetical protein